MAGSYYFPPPYLSCFSRVNISGNIEIECVEHCFLSVACMAYTTQQALYLWKSVLVLPKFYGTIDP